jgi:hypothetical protein
MPFESGKPRPKNAGRKKGSSNKSTDDIKQAFKNLVEDNIPNITNWMERVAEKNPDKALDFMHKFSQFNVPLLNRSEVKHEGEVTTKQVFEIGGKKIEF